MARAQTTGYRRPPTLELLGVAAAIFFAAVGFAGCSVLFPPLLLVSVPAVFMAPVVAFVTLRRQIQGPCPYCGADAGPSRKPFACRACGKRVMIADGAFVRVVKEADAPAVTPH